MNRRGISVTRFELSIRNKARSEAMPSYTQPYSSVTQSRYALKKKICPFGSAVCILIDRLSVCEINGELTSTTSALLWIALLFLLLFFLLLGFALTCWLLILHFNTQTHTHIETGNFKAWIIGFRQRNTAKLKKQYLEYSTFSVKAFLCRICIKY